MKITSPQFCDKRLQTDNNTCRVSFNYSGRSCPIAESVSRRCFTLSDLIAYTFNIFVNGLSCTSVHNGTAYPPSWLLKNSGICLFRSIKVLFVILCWPMRQNAITGLTSLREWRPVSPYRVSVDIAEQQHRWGSWTALYIIGAPTWQISLDNKNSNTHV